MRQIQGVEHQFWRYALPSMLSQLLNSFFIIVDGFFIGQNLGDAGLAAINVAWPIVAVIQASSLAIGTGGAVRLAMSVGRNDQDAALRVRGSTITMLALASLLLSVSLYFLSPLLLPLMGANEELFPLALSYARMACLLAGFQIFTTGLLPLLRGAGQAMTAMTLTVMGLISNIFLDWLFIHQFHWGMPGAALATGLSQGLCAVLSLPLLLFRRGWPLRRADFRPSSRLMAGILHYGISPFGLSLSTSVIILITNLRAMHYGGTGGVAVYAVLSYVLGSVLPLVSGVGDGIQPLLSHSQGAGNWHAVNQLRRKGLALAVGVSLLASVGCWTFRRELPLLFGTSPTAAAEGASAMWTLVLAFPFMAIVRFCCSYFCAVGQPGASSILAYGEPVISQPVFLILLPLFFHLTGVWLAYPAAVILMTAVTVYLMHLHVNSFPSEE